MKNIFLTVFFIVTNSFAHQIENFSSKPVLASLQDLQDINAPIWASDKTTGVAFTYLTPELQFQLQSQSHRKGKCGGFEVLPPTEAFDMNSILKEFEKLKKIHLKNQADLKGPVQFKTIQHQAFIEEALSRVQATQLQEMITWLSSFKSRNEMSKEPNAHVIQMKNKAEAWLQTWPGKWKSELIDHTSTKQKSLKITLLGQTKPDEIIVLGGHHDSTSYWGGNSGAPGADDNASGSSNLLEILRVLTEQKPSERTIEFMWYAAEESGLLGSAEIAKTYQSQKKDVIAVLQLDMTSYPGSGEMTIANITDFTTPWLHDLMKQLNQLYVGLKIVDDECGYACSDHASWYRQGYSTVVPFESTSEKMNPDIHSTADVVSPQLSFRHSAAITQLSLAFALELANSEQRSF